MEINNKDLGTLSYALARALRHEQNCIKAEQGRMQAGGAEIKRGQDLSSRALTASNLKRLLEAVQIEQIKIDKQNAGVSHDG